jgi:hypothetical protein
MRGRALIVPGRSASKSDGGRIAFAPYLETARVPGARKAMMKPYQSEELLGAVENLLGWGRDAAKPKG